MTTKPQEPEPTAPPRDLEAGLRESELRGLGLPGPYCRTCGSQVHWSWCYECLKRVQ